VTEDTWNRYAKRLIKSEMLKRDIKTEDLIVLLARIGVNETKSSINSKISRGTFSAAFLLQVLQVIGCKNLDLISPNDLTSRIESTQSRLEL
jgi:3-mercaptopyruvate sulfurtransferase SseA